MLYLIKLYFGEKNTRQFNVMCSEKSKRVVASMYNIEKISFCVFADLHYGNICRCLSKVTKQLLLSYYVL